MFIKAYASGSKGGAAGYRRAVAKQLAQETGVSTRAANKALRANAGGNAPFAGRGRRSTPTNVRKRTYRNLGR